MRPRLEMQDAQAIFQAEVPNLKILSLFHDADAEFADQPMLDSAGLYALRMCPNLTALYAKDSGITPQVLSNAKNLMDLCAITREPVSFAKGLLEIGLPALRCVHLTRHYMGTASDTDDEDEMLDPDTRAEAKQAG